MSSGRGLRCGCRCSWARACLAYYALRFEPAAWLGAAVAAPPLALAVWLARVALAAGPSRPPRWVSPQRNSPPPARRRSRRTCRPRPPSSPAQSERSRLCRRGAGSPSSRRGWMARRSRCADRCGSGCRRRTTGIWRAATRSALRALVRPPAPPSYPGGWDLQRDAFYSGLGASGYALGKAERTAAGGRRPARCGSCNGCARSSRGRVVAVIPGAAGAVSVTAADRRLDGDPGEPIMRRFAIRAWPICWRSLGCISASSWASR